ncbi:MAG: hypothetical protein K2H49_01730, partial [Muribaculaceae bacterium]|nr:hypothetical protein [Muribaculaceae bacterium]
MKKFLFSLTALLLGIGSTMAEGIVERAQKAWADVYPQVESRIKAPTFRDVDYNILQFDKKGKNKNAKNVKKDKHGNVLYTDIINSAIAKCSADGGGRVIVPAGTWLTGPVKLLSNVNLHLEEGAILLFTDDPHQYYPLVLTAWEGMNCWNWSPMIYAYQQEN